MLDPFEWTHLVAMGEVGPDNAADFITAGASGVGVCGDLCQSDLLRIGDFTGISRFASGLLSICQTADRKQ